MSKEIKKLEESVDLIGQLLNSVWDILNQEEKIIINSVTKNIEEVIETLKESC